MATTDYGTDISSVFDIEKNFELVTGLRGLAEALLRRLTTQNGSLFYDTNYGFDLRSLVESSYREPELVAIRALIEAECEKDERVLGASCTFTLDSATKTASCSIRISAKVGQFSLVLSVSNLTVALLRVEVP